MKILIVDDSKAIRNIIRRAFRQAGLADHQFLEAENGAAALDIVKADGPELILADWNMPVMSGIDFLREVRQAGNSVPFGFITSEGTDAMRQIAVDAGANFLLKKPFLPEDLATSIKPFMR